MSAIHLNATDSRFLWCYPTKESTITIDLCHVRVVDEVRIRFDFDAHEWIAEQQLQAATSLEPPTNEWVEVARWCGNAPEVGEYRG
jgi:hypothetical protein